MNPKKKSRRYRASVSIQALDLAISRFTNSLDCVHSWYGVDAIWHAPGVILQSHSVYTAR
jgi:hypothetical protein